MNDDGDDRSRSGGAVALLAVFVVVAAATAAVPPATALADDGGLPPETGAQSAGDVLVVDAGGGGDYQSIDAAVDAAEDGDTVRVRPGTYRERVTLTSNVTLVAPRGAILDGRSVSGNVSSISLRNDTHRGVAISIPERSDAAPVVAGFSVRGYLVGLDAGDTTGDWTVRNTSVRNVTFGVQASGATGDWTVRNTTIRDVTHFEAVDATWANGDWTITGVTLRNVTRGVDASQTTGTWQLRETTVTGAGLVAVDATGSEAAWTMRNVTIRDATVGLKTNAAEGDWAIRNTTFRNLTRSDRYDFLMPPIPEGTAIYARGTTGTWTVTDGRFVDLDGPAVVATGAVPGGTTSGNRFDGRRSPGPEACRGNVTCAGQPGTDGGGDSSTDTTGTGDAPDDEGTGTPTVDRTRTDAGDATGVRGPLSPVPAVLALLLVAALAARRVGS